MNLLDRLLADPELVAHASAHAGRQLAPGSHEVLLYLINLAVSRLSAIATLPAHFLASLVIVWQMLGFFIVCIGGTPWTEDEVRSTLAHADGTHAQCADTHSRRETQMLRLLCGRSLKIRCVFTPPAEIATALNERNPGVLVTEMLALTLALGFTTVVGPNKDIVYRDSKASDAPANARLLSSMRVTTDQHYRLRKRAAEQPPCARSPPAKRAACSDASFADSVYPPSDDLLYYGYDVCMPTPPSSDAGTSVCYDASMQTVLPQDPLDFYNKMDDLSFMDL